MTTWLDILGGLWPWNAKVFLLREPGDILSFVDQTTSDAVRSDNHLINTVVFF